jgi:hypothetical protein
MSFLAIPPELRIEIYQHIIYDVKDPLASIHEPYVAIALCCEQVRAESMSEWCKLSKKLFEAEMKYMEEYLQ